MHHLSSLYFYRNDFIDKIDNIFLKNKGDSIIEILSTIHAGSILLYIEGFVQRITNNKCFA